MRSKLTGYDVGALLYCPANAHGSIVGAIVEQRFPTPYSLAFCLEDTVREDAVADAERMLRGTLSRIASAAEGGSFFLPPIFVRVRSPEQLLRLAEEYRFPPFSADSSCPSFSWRTAGPILQPSAPSAGRRSTSICRCLSLRP